MSTNFTVTLAELVVPMSGDEYITRQIEGSLPQKIAFETFQLIVGLGYINCQCHIIWKEDEGNFSAQVGYWILIGYSPTTRWTVQFNGAYGTGSTLKQAEHACSEDSRSRSEAYLANQPRDLRDEMW